jgi:hypothetical protein
MNEDLHRPRQSNGNQLVDASPLFPDAEGGSNIIDDTEHTTPTFSPYMGQSEFATNRVC